MDLAALDPAQPHAFYLSDPSLEALSDCFAVVDGVRLPLHSHILAQQSAVLRELFLAQREGLASGERSGLSAAFASSSVEEAACLLRMLYSLRDTRPASFTALSTAGRLPAVAGLAHKLDVSPVLCP
jgi:hypothetical protein